MLTIITLILYGVAVFYETLRLRSTPTLISKSCSLLFGAVAVTAHAWLLHKFIDIGVGQNLTFLNLLSFVIWLVATLSILIATVKPVDNFFLLVFPLAILSILLMAIFPSRYVVDTAANPRHLTHILLSTLTFSVLCLAAIQAVLLTIQDQLLRKNYGKGLFQILPPIETMETLLFQLIVVGFLLLTMLLIISFIFYHSMTVIHLMPKILLSFMAWALFAILLGGRYLLGWRGRKAIGWTCAGVTLLVITYFGSKLLM